MKPGLRKIAALILASTTLFGGGALSASTAYADDTTLDTSTQLQAEPDTQTTMGGDVSETAPDNSSDNDAGTSPQNQSDDASPQTDTGQAAPDVTIHDMLDTDSASVSKLKLTGWTTGTAPFDKDNERGDDKDDNNAIVRSYDTVTYDYEYTLTPDDAMTYYRKARVGFRFDNTYQPQNVLVELAARKRLTGRELKAYEFEFELVDKDGKVIDTERNDKDGDIRFKPLEYARDNKNVDDRGEHEYVIREKNTGEKNVTYDKTEHHVTVTVSDNLQGNLTAKVQYDPEADAKADSSTMLVTPTDKADKTDGDAGEDENNPTTTPSMVTTAGTQPEFNNSYIPPVTPAIVKTIRQLAKTGVSTPTVALAAFTLLVVGLTVAYSVRRRHAVTPRHRR